MNCEENCRKKSNRNDKGENMQTHQGKLIQGAYVEDTSADNVNQFSQESNEENDQSDDYEMKL